LFAPVISDLLKQGLPDGDIVILSLRGLNCATLANRQRDGNFKQRAARVLHPAADLIIQLCLQLVEGG
jgi:hypothetical protein